VTHLPTFTCPGAQKTIAIAIFNQKFGGNPEDLCKLLRIPFVYHDPYCREILQEKLPVHVKIEPIENVPGDLKLFGSQFYAPSELRNAIAMLPSEELRRVMSGVPTAEGEIHDELSRFLLEQLESDLKQADTTAVAVTSSTPSIREPLFKAGLRIRAEIELFRQSVTDKIEGDAPRVRDPEKRNWLIQQSVRKTMDRMLSDRLKQSVEAQISSLSKEDGQKMLADFYLDEKLSVVTGDVGKRYAAQWFENLLISAEISDEGAFRGWISSEHYAMYKDCIRDLRIYSYREEDMKDGYPEVVQGAELSPSHTLFASLPAYMQVAVRDSAFDLDAFRHKDVIGFITETVMRPLLTEDPELAAKMLSVIQSCVLTMDTVRIASNPAEDGRLKDEMNTLCGTVKDNTNFSESMKIFLEGKDKKTVATTAYLLGKLASKGVLGYHHGGNNTANVLFYELSSQAFEHLNKMAVGPAITFPGAFFKDLKQGACIEQLSGNFLISNPWVQDVFATTRD